VGLLAYILNPCPNFDFSTLARHFPENSFPLNAIKKGLTPLFYPDLMDIGDNY